MAGNSQRMNALVLMMVACWSLPDTCAAPPASRTNDTSDATTADSSPDASPSKPLPTKPPCPSYVDCPWEYPKPTTKTPPSESAVGTSTELAPPLELHFQEHLSPPEGEQSGAEEMKKPETQQPVGGSVSATQKPTCPFYASCPWEYPKPTTKAPSPDEHNDTDTPAVMQSTEKPPVLVEHFLETNSQPGQETKPQQPTGGSLPATQKPTCPSYASCPWEYPKPTTKAPPSNTDNDTEATSGLQTMGNAPLLVEHILEIESEPNQETKKPDVQQPSSGSISATQKPSCPGYASCPWEYPKPTTKAPPVDNGVSTTPTKDSAQLIEHFLDVGSPALTDETAGEIAKEPIAVDGAASPTESKPTAGVSVQSVAGSVGEGSGSSESSGDSSEEKTEKPLCPSYAECPWDYPKPTTKRPGGSPQAPSKSSEESSISSEETGTPLSEGSNGPSGAAAGLPLVSEEVIDCSNKKETPEVPVVNNRDEPNKYPSIPIRPHTEYPFYLPGPWEYPKPTTGPTVSETQVTDEPLVEYFGSDSKNPQTVSEIGIKEPTSVTPLNEKPTQTSGGWIFPETHNGASSITDSQTTEQVVNYFGSSNSHQSGSGSLQGGPCPSYGSCPWQYPRPPAGSLTSAESNINQEKDKKPHSTNEEINELLGSNIESTKNPIDLANQGAFLPIYSYLYGLGNYGQSGSYFSNSRPSVLLKPGSYRPSYLVNLWNHPRPLGNNDEYNAASEERNTAATKDDVDNVVNSDNIASEVS